MSFEIRLKKQEGPGEGFTFPLEMQLDEKVVKGLKLEPALRRLAKALIKQHKFSSASGNLKATLGVNFIEIGFNYVLDTVPAKEQRVAERLMK